MPMLLQFNPVKRKEAIGNVRADIGDVGAGCGAAVGAGGAETFLAQQHAVVGELAAADLLELCSRSGTVRARFSSPATS